MKAVNSIHSGNYLKVDALTTDGRNTVSTTGSQITPRGVIACCTEEQITHLHSADNTDAQPKFQTLLLSLELGFNSGEVIQLETEARVQSIRRVSQSDFEVYMAFSNMIQDGYRHIARYIVDVETQETE